MNWMDIKNFLPPLEERGICEKEFILAFHTIHGIGVAWFWKFDEGMIEILEEDFHDKYLCSCQFIKNKLDGNWSIDDEDKIDIFLNSPHFWNLGTVSHWMNLPAKPMNI